MGGHRRVLKTQSGDRDRSASQGCSWNDVEDRFGEGGGVGMREMLVPA